MPVRPMRPADRIAVLAMMRALWPDDGGSVLDYPQRVWVWQGAGRALLGFVTCSTRPFANGCESMPVQFVEGWYVVPPH